MSWAAIHDAPRDARIWAFCPAMRWTSDAHGRPTKVEDGVIVAEWRADYHQHHGVWVNVETGHPVYPSLWHELKDAAPEAPKR